MNLAPDGRICDNDLMRRHCGCSHLQQRMSA